MEPLTELEEASIYVMREAKARCQHLAAMWSVGKDSTVLIAIARKAFFGHVPFPLIHIDNGLDFPETYQLRDQLVRDWNLDLMVAKSEVEPDSAAPVCCGGNKTAALRRLLDERRFDGIFVSIRRDEHGIRAKERYFSPRDREFRWDYQNQPPEVWHFISDQPGAFHIRIHPLLHWTEADIWAYIKQEQLPFHSLYLARNGHRYRSLGCTQCTVSVPSNATTIDEILEELFLKTTSERAGRMQDKEEEYVMQRLRALGYM